MPLLEIDGVEAGYGQMVVLQDVTIAVEPGTCVAVLGRNGAGKTTLMRTVSGLLRPSKGKISFQGKPITGLNVPAIARLGIGHVQEGRRIFRRQSVLDNLRLGAYGAASGQSLASRFERVWELFPVLRHKQRDPAGLLSGGQQQMLAIGQAMMAGPSLLLLDEPSAGLAPILIEELFEALRRMREQSAVAILLAEQYVERALDISSYGHVLERGRVVMSGEAAKLSGDQRLTDIYLGAGSS